MSVILFVFPGLGISSCALAHTDTLAKHTDRYKGGVRQNESTWLT